MIPTHLREHRFRLYAAAIFCGLVAGLGMLVWQGSGSQNVSSASCRAESPARLAAFAKGDVAAFVAVPIRVAPDLTFARDNGAQAHLSEFIGQTVLVNLWATWCVPCREEMPALNQLQKKRDGRLAVLALSLDTERAKAKDFYIEHKIDALPLYSDAAGAAFQALRKSGLGAGLPTSLLIDAQGCLLGHLSGPADWAGDDAAALIDAALAR